MWLKPFYLVGLLAFWDTENFNTLKCFFVEISTKKSTKKESNKMNKQVQIPEELFNNLLALVFCEPTKEIQEKCEKGLLEKLERMALHELYSKTKNKTLSEEEREKARQDYLDRKGIHTDFRY